MELFSTGAGRSLLSRAATLVATAPLALALSSAPQEYGGKEVGCIDFDGGVSVVTVATPNNARTVARGIYLQHAPHDWYDPEILVMYRNTDVLDIGAEYFSGNPGIATVSNATSVHLTPGFTHGHNQMGLLGHEFHHRWVLGSTVFIPVLVESEVSAAGREPGVLIDESQSFPGLVWIGDLLRFPGSTFLTFRVSAVAEHQLEFELSSGDPTTYVPAAGADYEVTTQDLRGRQNAHWTPFSDMQGSFLDGNDLELVGTDASGQEVFEVLAVEYRSAPYDLYLMGLATVGELYPLDVVKNPDDPFEDPVVIDGWFVGTHRVMTPEQVTANEPVAYDPRNIQTRFLIVTVIGEPVSAETIENLDHVRRDFLAKLSFDSGGVGSISTVHDQTLPDLVVGDVDVTSFLTPGAFNTLRVYVQNQGAEPAEDFRLEVGITELGGGPIGATLVSGLGAHELRQVEVTFFLPAEDMLFGAGPYRGSVEAVLTADRLQDVQEVDEDHNVESTDVPLASSTGATAALTWSVVGGPVTDGSSLYVLRRTGPGTAEIVVVDTNDPTAPALVEAPGGAELAVAYDGVPGAMAANAHALGVADPNLDSVRLYDLPLSPGATHAADLSGFGLGLTLEAAGDVLYVGSGLTGGVHVVGGLEEPARAAIVDSFAPGVAVSLMHASGSRLYVVPNSLSGVPVPDVLVYDISDPTQVVQVDSFDLGSVLSIADLVVDEQRGFLAVATSDSGVLRVGLSSHQVEDTWTTYGARLGGLEATAGQLLARSTTDGGAYSLDASAGTLEERSLLYFAPQTTSNTIQPSMKEFRGWIAYADGRGLRFFSPTGTTDRFVRGDTNADGHVDMADFVRFVSVVHQGGSFAGLQDAFDVDDDGSIDDDDGTYLTAYLFGGGPQPPAPFPVEGTDPTADDLIYVRPRD